MLLTETIYFHSPSYGNLIISAFWDPKGNEATSAYSCSYRGVLGSYRVDPAVLRFGVWGTDTNRRDYCRNFVKSGAKAVVLRELTVAIAAANDHILACRNVLQAHNSDPRLPPLSPEKKAQYSNECVTAGNAQVELEGARYALVHWRHIDD